MLWVQVQIKAGGKYCLQLCQLPPKQSWDYTRFCTVAHQPLGNEARSLQNCKSLQSWIRLHIPVLKADKILKLSQQAHPNYPSQSRLPVMPTASVPVNITQKDLETCQFEMECMHFVDCLEYIYYIYIYIYSTK